MEKGIIRIIVIGLICLLVVSCMPLVYGEEYPDFPKNKMVIVGRYSSLNEHESKGISRDLHITCNQGDITVYIAKWWKSGYSSWGYGRHIYDKYIHFHAPRFYGICRDGQIFGISYGEISFS